MRARLLAGFLVFALIVGVALEVPLGFDLQSRDQSSALASVEHGAASLSFAMSTALESGHGASELARRYAATIGGDVVVSSRDRVLASGGPDGAEELRDPGIATIERLARRGEVAGIDPASQSDDALLYAAMPLDPLKGARGAIRPVLLVASSSAPLESRVRRDWLELAAFGLGMVVVAAVAGSLLARSLTRPLQRIEVAVAGLGDGDLGKRAPTGDGPAELRELAATVNAMADQIGGLLEAQRSFVADASHQLRSPLTALRLRIENLEHALTARPGQLPGAVVAPAGGALALRRPSGVEATVHDELAARALAAMSAEVERLSRLVDGLLTLARGEGARPEREPVDVAEMLDERAAAWQALADEQGVHLAVTGVPPAGAGTVLACSGHLEQILDNLLANAFAASPTGSTVSVTAVQARDLVEIHVLDEGPGMAREDRQRAFQRFWRGKRAPEGGSGLGLAIVEQLARASGGSVVLEESPGGGLDAVVRLEAC